MTEILERNIQNIKQFNPSICKKILAVDSFSKDYELNTNLAGEYNLLADGMAIHSITGAQQEAKDVFEKLPHNTPNSVHVIYGLGLGYLFDEFSQNANGFVILYEDDIELLRFVLEAVDFSSVFEKHNCFIVSDFEEYRHIFESVFRYRSRVSLSALDFYTMHRKDQYDLFAKEVERLYSMYDHNYSFQVHQIFSFLQQTLINLPEKFKCPLLTDSKNLLKDKPAVIVSAGPSLAKNIETLKKYRDNVYIFCVGTALKTLLSNGIVPDFLHIIERLNTAVHYNVPETKDMILVCEPYTSHYVHEMPFRKIFLTASEETDASRWYMDTLGKDFVPFETKGTVSYHALYSAMCLGCNPIILIGQDLAYSDGNCYAKGSAFEDLECFFDEKLQKYRIYPKNFEKYRDAYYAPLNLTDEQKNERLNKALEKFNSELVTVDGQNGEKLPTSAAYAMFIEYIKEFGLRFNKERILINSSAGGAQIDGFANQSFDSALDKYAQNPLDKTLIKDAAFESNCNNKEIILRLQSDINAMGQVVSFLKKGKQYVEKASQELDNRKVYNQVAAKNLEKASALYVEITNKYMLRNKLLRMISMKEHSELAYMMKQNNSDESLDLASAQKFLNAFDNYYNNVFENIRWVWWFLRKAILQMEEE